MAKFVTSGLFIAGETYSIEEAKAPAGYEKLPTWQFKITDAGHRRSGGRGFLLAGQSPTAVR